LILLNRHADSAQVGLADDRLDVLFEPPIPFEDLPVRLPYVLGPASGILCQAINYS